jgi:preprotein translocase subunit YajC
VLNLLLETMWLLADGPAPKAPAPAEDPGILGTLFTNPIIPMVMLGIVAYLMLMRPEQKRRKEMEKLLADIKKNDKIILGSGICGTVVNAEPKSIYVTIKVDESTNTKLRVLRSAIVRVGQPDEADGNAKEAG